MGFRGRRVGQKSAPLARWCLFDDALAETLPYPGEYRPHRGKTHLPTGCLCVDRAL